MRKGIEKEVMGSAHGHNRRDGDALLLLPCGTGVSESYLFNPTQFQLHIVRGYARISWHGKQPTRCDYSVSRRPTSLL